MSYFRDDDIDRFGKRVRIDEAFLTIGATTHLEAATKTDESEGWVTVPDFVIGELVEHMKVYLGDDEPRGRLLFTNAKGQPINRHWFNRRVWKPALKRAGVSERFQAKHLHHTGASLIRELGGDEKDVQEALRHTSPVMARHYVASYDDRRGRIAAAIKGRVRPIANAQSGE